MSLLGGDGGQRRAPLVVVALAAFGFAVGLRQIDDPDYWTHVSLGRAVFAARSSSIVEPFLAGPDVSKAPAAPPEWPFQVALYGVRALAGDAGVSVAIAGCVALLALLLGSPLHGFASGRRIAAALAFLCAALFVARFRFAPRPEVVGYVFLAGALLLVRRFTVAPTWTSLMGLAAVLAVWRSLHVSWTLGAAFVALVLAFSPRLDFWRRQPRWVLAAVLLVGSVVALEAARFGLAVVRSMRAGEVFWAVTEMRPTFEFPVLAWPFAAVAAAGAVLAWGVREGRFGRMALIAAAAGLGTVAVRNVALAAVVIAFAGIEGLSRPPGEADRRSGWVVAAGVALALPALFGLAWLDREPPMGVGIDWRWFPRDAAEWVRARELPGPVFNSWTLGGYLDYAWGGRPPTFLDGRLGNAGRLALHDAIEVPATAGAALELGGFRTLVVAPVYSNDAMLVSSVPWLIMHPQWRLVRASDALVFVREPLPPGVTALDPGEAWRAVLRATEPLADQALLSVEHLRFTRAIAYLRLGDLENARREYEAGRKRHPDVAAQYGVMERLLPASAPPQVRPGEAT